MCEAAVGNAHDRSKDGHVKSTTSIGAVTIECTVADARVRGSRGDVLEIDGAAVAAGQVSGEGAVGNAQRPQDANSTAAPYAAAGKVTAEFAVADAHLDTGNGRNSASGTTALVIDEGTAIDSQSLAGEFNGSAIVRAEPVV